MQGGEFDRYITIETVLPETLNSRGDPLEAAPAVFVQIWAKYRQLPGGGESQAGGQKTYARMLGEWTTRYVPGILTTMKVNENGVRYDINTVDESLKRKGFLILTTELRGA